MFFRCNTCIIVAYHSTPGPLGFPPRAQSQPHFPLFHQTPRHCTAPQTTKSSPASALRLLPSLATSSRSQASKVRVVGLRSSKSQAPCSRRGLLIEHA